MVFPAPQDSYDPSGFHHRYESGTIIRTVVFTQITARNSYLSKL